jgi:hypothetical protein
VPSGNRPYHPPNGVISRDAFGAEPADLGGFVTGATVELGGTRNAWLSGCSGEVGGDDVGGVAVEGSSGPVIAHGGSGAAWEAATWTSLSANPGVKGGGDV